MMKPDLKIVLVILTVMMGFPLFGGKPVMKDLQGDTLSPRIDTHIHLYDTHREGSCIFLDPVRHEKIYFPHFAQQFVDTASPAGIGYAVVVEASQRREDNFWLMRHVDSSEALVAFIANLDPRDPHYVSDLDSLSQYEKFRGIRIRPSTPIDISKAEIIASFSHLASRNQVLELGGAGVDPQTIATIARQYPGMNIIMNHLAGGMIQGGAVVPADWTDRLAVFASEPNVYCKISALYTLSGQDPAPVDPEAYKPLIDPAIEAFGPGRVIFGSNWTLSDMLGSYGDMITMLDGYLLSRDDLTPEQFYYENINEAYGINQSEVGVDISQITGERFLLYPNPARQTVTISTPDRSLGHLQCIDLRGRVVLEDVVYEDSIELNISEWVPGIYCVQRITEEGAIVQQLLVN
ncbi:MAG: amidohydrolase family protein [Bacteroidota bacterium]